MQPTITPELAFALGVRDCIAGVDADTRRSTVERFDGAAYLEHAYYSGLLECDHYISNIGRWAEEFGRKAAA